MFVSDFYACWDFVFNDEIDSFGGAEAAIESIWRAPKFILTAVHHIALLYLTSKLSNVSFQT